MKLAHDVVIFKSDEVKYETFIGNNDINAFVSSYNGREIRGRGKFLCLAKYHR